MLLVFVLTSATAAPLSMPPATAAAPLSVPFASGAAVPGLPPAAAQHKYSYSFGIPALTTSPSGALLAFCQANLVTPKQLALELEHGYNATDGRGGWTDLALRRSTDGGRTWGALQVVCRNR